MDQQRILEHLLVKSNLQKAYKAYLALEENENDEASEKIIEQCDDVFFKNEKEINDILEAFAEKNLEFNNN